MHALVATRRTIWKLPSPYKPTLTKLQLPTEINWSSACSMCRLLNCKVNWEDIVRPLQKIGTTAVVCVSSWNFQGETPKTTAKEWQQPATSSAVTNTSFILNPYRASIVELEHRLMIAWGSVCRGLCCVLFGILSLLNVLVLHLCRSYSLQ